MNVVLVETSLPGERSLQLVQGDLTEEAVDAIVNAANEHLAHGGGVAGVISRRGGPQIQRESDEWVRRHGPVSHAEPAYTGAGRLPCRWVIHAVGPIWGQGDEDARLTAAVSGELRVADELGAQSISLPALSTGIFGFPKPRAGRLILTAIVGYFSDRPASGVRQVRLVLYDNPTCEAFRSAWHDHFGAESAD